MKVFIDTNILVDLICERDGYAEDAQQIFTLAYQGQISLVISALCILGDVINNLLRDCCSH
jgi:predicted nucleic acid-binding protein